jgi:hypothetical protein
MPPWPTRSPVTEPARVNLPWIFRPRGTDTRPAADTDTQPDTGITPQPDTDTDIQADTQPGAEGDTREPVSPAGPGIAHLPILKADGGRLSRGDRFAAWFNDQSEIRRDLLWPYICLIGRTRNGQPDSMATYRRHARSGDWVHPAMGGRGRTFFYWAGRAYHALWGHWVHKLGLSLAYCAPRPLRMAAWLLFAIVSVFAFAAFIRFI